MDGAVRFEGSPDFFHVKSHEMPELNVGDFPLSLHLAEPSSRWAALFIKKDFQEALCSDELVRLGGCFVHGSVWVIFGLARRFRPAGSRLFEPPERVGLR